MMKDRNCVAITQPDNKPPAAPGATNLVLSEKKDKVAILTLNDPDRRNCLSLAMLAELQSALDDLAGDGHAI